jgi:hypothetical protein
MLLPYFCGLVYKWHLTVKYLESNSTGKSRLYKWLVRLSQDKFFTHRASFQKQIVVVQNFIGIYL